MKKLTIKEQKLKLLEETVAYYEQDPSRRAIYDDVECAYRMKCEDGTVKKCAVGRLIPDHRYDSSIEGYTVEELYNEEEMLHKVLPKKYSKLGYKFLNSLQKLHDFDNYWTGSFAAEKRLGKVEVIKNSILIGVI